MTVHSLDDYLSTVRLIRDNWDVPDHRELWFRAEDERHKETRLQPCLYRPKRGAQRKPVRELLEIESDLYEEFTRCATQLDDMQFRDAEWDPYFLMQHHGVPTRLLDWSDGALVALHFAVRNKTEPFDTGALIYVLDSYWLDDVLEKDRDRTRAVERWERYCKKHPHDRDPEDWDRLYLPMDDNDDPLLATPKSPLLWDSPHVSRRVAAQRSRFMIFGTDPLWLSELAKKRSARLDSVHIDATAIVEIKQGLRDAGITESVIFPDWDGLGRELRQVWEARR
jgi:FRG domain-containing protein